jgi:hypothetical protein
MYLRSDCSQAAEAGDNMLAAFYSEKAGRAETGRGALGAAIEAMAYARFRERGRPARLMPQEFRRGACRR